MAKIILNVDLDFKAANSRIETLKNSLKTVAKSLEDIKPNNDLTKQIQSLAELYKRLGEAAKTAEAQTAKQADTDAKAAINAAKKAKAEAEKAAALEKQRAAAEKANQEAAKTLIQESKLEAQAAKTAAQVEKLAQASQKAAEASEEEEKPLWKLERAFSALSIQYQNTAQKYPLLAESLGGYRKEVDETAEALVRYNRGTSDEIEDSDTLRERYDRLSASLATLTANSLEYNRAQEAAEKETARLNKEMEAAEKSILATDTRLLGFLKRIAGEENRYENGAFDSIKKQITALLDESAKLKKSDENYIQKSEELKKKTAEVAKELVALEAAQRELANQTETLGEKFTSFSLKIGKTFASAIWRKYSQAVKNALLEVDDVLVNVENKVIELRRVIEDPPEKMEISDRLFDLAYQYGQTFDAAAEIAANFARSGRDWNETIQATEAALLAMNVAELNASQSSEGLLSILTQFKLETEDLMLVIDKLNKTADKNPVTTGKLLTALQRTGSAAVNANLSLDRTVGVITALSAATNRSGQNLGTAVNSLLQYSSKAESLDIFAKLSDSAADMVEKYRIGAADIVDVWEAVSVELSKLQEMSVEKQNELFALFDTEEVEQLSSSLHDELGDIFEQIGDVYGVANTYRKNYFIALLANMKKVLEVQDDMADAAGYSQRENEQFMESYTAKVNQLRAAWEKLANDEQGILKFNKWLVDAGLLTSKVVDGLGGIGPVIAEIVTLVGGLLLIINASKISIKITEVIETLRLAKNAIMGVKAATDATTTAAAGLQAASGVFGLIAIAISAAITGISALIRAQEREREKLKEERDAKIKDYEASKKQADELVRLRKELDALNPQSEEHRKVEDEIVTLLGEKKILLEDLTQGTADYTEKVKELTDAEIEHERFLRKQAKEAAGENLRETLTKYIDDNIHLGYQEIDGRELFDHFEDAGVVRLSLLGNKWSEDISGYMPVLKMLIEESQRLEKEYEKLDVSMHEFSLGEELAHKRRVDFLTTVLPVYEAYTAYIDEEIALSKSATYAWDKYQNALQEAIDSSSKFAGKSREELEAMAESLGVTLEEMVGFKGIAEETTEAVDGFAGSVREATEAESEFADRVSGKFAGLAESAEAVRAVEAAMLEFRETGEVSLETVKKLAALGPEWVSVLFDETGALNLNSEAVRGLIADTRELLAENGFVIESADTLASQAEKIADKISELNGEIDSVQSALSTLNEVQKEYDATGSLSIDTMQKLIGLGAEYVDLIEFENGQLKINQDKVDALTKSKEDLISELIAQQTAEYAVNRLHYYMAQSTEEMGKTASTAAQRVHLAALAMRQLEGDEEGAQRAINQFEEALARLAYSEGVLSADWYEQWRDDVFEFEKGLNDLYSVTDKGRESWAKSAEESSSKAKKETDEVLEGHKQLVSLLESELTLMEHQGASDEDRIAKIQAIQAAIHDQAEHLRSIVVSEEEAAAHQAEINKLSADWWKWQEKIAAIHKENADAQKKAAEDAKKAAEEAKKAEEEARKARIAALNEETDRHKQIISDLKAELNLWQKQGKGVSDQVGEMKRIQDALHDQAEWLRYLKDTQDDIKVTQAEIDALSAEWWDWQEKILKLYQETLDAAKKIELDAQQKVIDGILAELDARQDEIDLNEKILSIEKARLDVANAIRDAQLDYVKSVLSDYIKALSDAETLEAKQNAVIEARAKLVEAEQEARSKAFIEAFKAEKNAKDETLSIEEKRLAVEKARQALEDSKNNKTTRVFNEKTGDWEHTSNAKAVQTAQDNLEKAIAALNDSIASEAWKEVEAAIEAGSVSEEAVLAILSKWAKEAYGEGSPEFVAKIQAAFRKAMGTPVNPETLAGQVSAVDKAVESLNDYLKQEAVKELEEYIAAGNTDTAGMRAILNKWLSLGSGGELYEWRDGLLETLNRAIVSGYYDDTKVTSYIERVESSVESLHSYLRSRFIAEMKDLVQNGTAEQIRAAISEWDTRFSSVGAQIGRNDFGLSGEDSSWAGRLADEKARYEETEQFWNTATQPKHTEEEKRRVIERMKANSLEWWTATDTRKKELSDLNYVLGTSMGWQRKQDGAWYDENDIRLYDRGGVVWNPGPGKTSKSERSGGVLRGVGGIKATDKPEIVLDPELTSKILTPTSEKHFRAFAESMHLIFEKGTRTRAELPVIRPISQTDSHDTSYTVNGIPIPAASAERYTIAELFRALPGAKA